MKNETWVLIYLGYKKLFSGLGLSILLTVRPELKLQTYGTGPDAQRPPLSVGGAQ